MRNKNDAAVAYFIALVVVNLAMMVAIVVWAGPARNSGSKTIEATTTVSAGAPGLPQNVTGEQVGSLPEQRGRR